MYLLSPRKGFGDIYLGLLLSKFISNTITLTPTLINQPLSTINITSFLNQPQPNPKPNKQTQNGSLTNLHHRESSSPKATDRSPRRPTQSSQTRGTRESVRCASHRVHAASKGDWGWTLGVVLNERPSLLSMLFNTGDLPGSMGLSWSWLVWIINCVDTTSESR